MSVLSSRGETARLIRFWINRRQTAALEKESSSAVMTLELLLRRTVYPTTTQWNSGKKMTNRLLLPSLSYFNSNNMFTSHPALLEGLFHKVKRKQFKTQLKKDENNKCADCVVTGLICPALRLTVFTDVICEKDTKRQKKPTPHRTGSFQAKWAETLGSVTAQKLDLLS